MSKLFLAVLNMSLKASYVIAFVILARLLLKKAPKIISYVLWSVVAFRLIIPFSFESIFSLMPRNTDAIEISADIVYQQSPQINGKIETSGSVIDKSVSSTAAAIKTVSPVKIIIEAVTYIWFLGVIVLLAYSFISVLRLRKRLKAAKLIESNIYETDNLKTPFVLGIINPKIYLPQGLPTEERSFILLHEQTHIRRKDNLVKILAFFIAAIHWFNALVWISFMLMSTDMELSCDERVLKLMKEDIKRSYVGSLLSLAAGRHVLNGSPLAFGEGDIKNRIKNVLYYKKPGFWIIFSSIIVVVLIILGLAANPKSKQSIIGTSYRVKEILYQAPMYSFTYTLENAPNYGISSDFVLYIKESNDVWTRQGELYNYEIGKDELKALFLPLIDDNVNSKYIEAINKTKLVYHVDSISMDHLLLQLKNGDLLLATGYDFNESGHIRWLFRLEKAGDYDDATLIIDKSSLAIRWDVAGYVPQAVREYAVDYVKEQIEYYNSLGCDISEAKITAMDTMNTGTASNTMAIEMWLLEYRLKPENTDNLNMTEGVKIEDGWLTEWNKKGQPYLLIASYYDEDEETEAWQRICVTYTQEIQQNYDTEEMLEEYGNKFTAATMELYKKYIKQ